MVLHNDIGSYSGLYVRSLCLEFWLRLKSEACSPEDPSTRCLKAPVPNALEGTVLEPGTSNTGCLDSLYHISCFTLHGRRYWYDGVGSQHM